MNWLCELCVLRGCFLSYRRHRAIDLPRRQGDEQVDAGGEPQRGARAEDLQHVERRRHAAEHPGCNHEDPRSRFFVGPWDQLDESVTDDGE